MRIIAPVVSKFESICSSMPWIVKRYMSFYDKVLDREIALAGISETDTVLNIGCGSIPFSAIYESVGLSGHKKPRKVETSLKVYGILSLIKVSIVWR